MNQILMFIISKTDYFQLWNLYKRQNLLNYWSKGTSGITLHGRPHNITLTVPFSRHFNPAPVQKVELQKVEWQKVERS